MSDKRRLYSRWMNTLDANKSTIALVDLQTEQKLTFLELDRLLQEKPSTSDPVIAESSGVDFIIHALWAWREGVAFIPMEASSRLDLKRLNGIPSETAHVKHTSGTTGEPRLVLFTQCQLEADADQIVKSMGLTEYDWNIGLISIVHSYGFSSLILPLLLHGIPLILGNSPLPETLKLALAQVNDRAVLPAVPAMWSAWHKSGILMNSSIGLAVSAGAPLSVELEKEIFISSGIKVHNFYGSSECGGIAYDYSNEVRSSSNIVGRPISGVSIDLSESGRLMVGSQAAAIGYWPAESSGELGNSQFITPDLAEIDQATGDVILIGRINEIINVAGRKLSPLDVEKVMMGIAGIQLCVVFGVPSNDADRVEDIVVCYSALKNMDKKHLSGEMLKKLPAWKLPRILWQHNALTMNNLGKLSRSHWRQQFLKRSR